MFFAATLLPALLAAAPSAPCSLEAGAAEIAAALERRKTARRGALPAMEEELWAQHGWQESCAPLAAAWLAGPEASRRVVAAAWFWEHRTQEHESRIYIPIVTELFDFHSIRGTSQRTLPLSAQQRDAFVAGAAAETDPMVLRVQVEQLMELGDLERARAAVRAGLQLVPRDEELLGYAFALWNRPKPPPLSKAERDLVWSLRDGEHSALARAVLSLQRDPQWIAWLTSHLKPENYEHASLAGLSPRFSKKVIDGARAQIARSKTSFALTRVPSQLRGAKAEEILALAETMLACDDKLSAVWDELLTAAAWSPEAGAALTGLIQLQGTRGEPAFWRYGDNAIKKAASLDSDEAIGPLLEVLRVSAAPRGEESRSTWRFADEVLAQLARLRTPAAADAVLEVARLCSGPCEGSGGDCLWRMRDQAQRALETLGGPGLDQRKAALAAIKPDPSAARK
ncbi:MAG TPA: hypothetical protein VGK67_07950 [Myxococcales bacterium]|jgi:hypothetical protein